MIPVHEVMPHALAVVLRNAPLTPDKIAFAWRTAVGPALDRVTTTDLKGSILYVHARDAAWQREVERSVSLIRTRLCALLGDNVVRAINVTLS